MKNKNFTGITDVPVGFEVKPFEELLFKDGELCNGNFYNDTLKFGNVCISGYLKDGKPDFMNGVCQWNRHFGGKVIAEGIVVYDNDVEKKFIFEKNWIETNDGEPLTGYFFERSENGVVTQVLDVLEGNPMEVGISKIEDGQEGICEENGKHCNCVYVKSDNTVEIIRE
jgi:hypothetical protein